MPLIRLRLTGSLSLLTLAAVLSACASSSAQPSGHAAPAARTTASPAVTAAQLQAVTDRTGKQQWRTLLPMASVSTPLVAGGLVVVGGTNDCAGDHVTVTALSAATGRKVWQVSVRTTFPCGFSPPLSLAGDVIVAGGILGSSPDPHNACPPSRSRTSTQLPEVAPLVGLDLATGHVRWRAPAIANTVVATAPDAVFARAQGSGCLVALNARTGRVRWSVHPKVSPLEITSGAAGTFLAGQQTNGTSQLVRLDPKTGVTRWITALPFFTSVGQPVVTRVVTVVLDIETGVPPPPAPGAPSASPVTSVPVQSRAIVTYNPATGRELWRLRADDGVVQTELLNDPAGVLVGHDGTHLTIEALDPVTGHRRWLSAPIARSRGLIAASGTSVLTGTINDLVALNASDGRQRWSIPEPSFVLAAVGGKNDYVALYGAPKNRPSGD